MRPRTLYGVRVAILAADGFEQVELTQPARAFEKDGAEVRIVSLRPGSIRGLNLIARGKKVKVDHTLLEVSGFEFDALYIPGGFANPDFLRQSQLALDFVRDFDRTGKPIAVMCHAPWVLISAGLVSGRRLASWPGIADDVRNAGAIWQDAPAVWDANWISSRGPNDLPEFVPKIVQHFASFVSHRAAPSPRAVWPKRVAAAALLGGIAVAARQTLAAGANA